MQLSHLSLQALSFSRLFGSNAMPFFWHSDATPAQFGQLRTRVIALAHPGLQPHRTIPNPGPSISFWGSGREMCCNVTPSPRFPIRPAISDRGLSAAYTGYMLKGERSPNVDITSAKMFLSSLMEYFRDLNGDEVPRLREQPGCYLYAA